MRISYLSVILLLISTTLFGQHTIPPIQNYSSVEYDGASQNWDIGVDEIGNVYAANNQGLLEYDGQRWELFPLRNGGVIRSVLPHKGRIYTGSYKEFGYWKRNSAGEMIYTSLMPLLTDSLDSEEFWEIVAFQDDIYFRSFGAIYRYDDKKKKIDQLVREVSNKMAVYEDKLLLAVGKEGLFFLKEDGELDPLPNQEVLAGKRVLDIEVDGKNLFLGTKDALYTFNGDYFQLLPNQDLNKKLSDFEFNHIMKINENELLLATVRGGILHHDLYSGLTRIYNREKGLQNNTVLGMAKKNGKIWLGLDNGIDKLDLQSPIKFFTDHTGELGAVYDLVHFKEKLYAASNTGVYVIDSTGISMIEGSLGHSWNLQVIDGTLFVNHNSGTFKIINDEFIPVDRRTGSFQIQKVDPHQSQYFIGNYTGISVYNASLDSLINLTGLNFPVKKLIFEDPYTAWAEHKNEGIYRIRFNQDLTQATALERVANDKQEISHRSKVFTLDEQIVVLRNKQWFRYNKILDSLEAFKELSRFNNHELLLEEENGYWFSNKKTNSLSYTDFRNTEIEISFGELGRRTVKDYEALSKINDSIYILALKDGFARINLPKLVAHRQQKVLNKPYIKGIQDDKTRYSLNSELSIPYEDAKNLTVYAGLPGDEIEGLHYELSGDQNLSGKVLNGRLSFQNLPHGKYQLNLFGMSPQGLRSETTSLNFMVGAPWYLSLKMKLLYLLILLILTLIIYQVNKQKLKKHRLVLEQKLAREHQERLDRLEKEKLHDEIMMKRKELANTTMMAAKKNEVLMDIQGELNKDKEKFTNQYRLKHIMNKINKAIKNQDEWQVFETNFKEVHEDFSKDILEKYPNLTGKDLKLCSYLKMNLSSKEIAPLMGKSVRGVEVHRYRLRKKLKLDSQENLSNFLLKNF